MDSTDGGAQATRRYTHVLNAVAQTAWAILPETLETIKEIVAMRAEGMSFTQEEIRERIGADFEQPQPFLVAARGGGQARGGAVAVLPMCGVLMPRATMMSQFSGGTSLQEFGSMLREAVNNPDVGSILIDIDSPGGSTSLVAETAALVREANASKPVYAIANVMAASGAYWICSQARELIVSPSGMVGSIGVFTTHDDISAMAEKAGVKRTYISAGKKKVAGNPFEPLSDEARADIQAMVDDFYGLFVTDVASGRGVSPKDVRDGFGQGGVETAKKAVKAGMADRVATFEQTIARLVRGGGAPGARADTGISISLEGARIPNAKEIADKIRAELALAPESKIDDEPEAPVEPAAEPASLLPGAERLLARPSFRQLSKAIPNKED